MKDEIIYEQFTSFFYGQPILYWQPANWQDLQQYSSSLYWAKLWPASIGLCNFISKNNYLIKGKKVLELGAGIGLPSLVCSALAKTVLCTDVMNEAVQCIKKSIALNGFTNIETQILDWHSFPLELVFDVLIAADINYNQSSFDTLHELFTKVLQVGKTIVISTPQRLGAKSFLLPLLPFVRQQENFVIPSSGHETLVSVFVIKIGIDNKGSEL